MSHSAPVVEAKETSSRPSLIPPEEQFWQRYSPHQEAPLSGVSSAVLHILVIVLLLGVLWLQKKLEHDKVNEPVPFEPVRLVVGNGEQNGKNDRPGKDKEPGKGTVGEPGELSVDPTKNAPTPGEHQRLSPAQVQKIEEIRKADGVRVAPEFSTEALNAYLNMETEARKKLQKVLRPGDGGKGNRSPGKDDGKGTGVPEREPREERVLRWALTFNTKSGRDYLDQLAALGAMVAVPVPGKAGNFVLIRDLKNPDLAREEDVTTLDSIYWIDEKADSVKSLFSALKGFKQPPYFVAFFPSRLEKRLLNLEMDYANRRYYGRVKEEQIHETKFDVVRSGEAGYDVKVREVILKPKK